MTRWDWIGLLTRLVILSLKQPSYEIRRIIYF